MTLALTDDLIRKLRHSQVDPGPSPNVVTMEDADFAALRDELLSSRSDDCAVWIFAYGSLLWKPCYQAAEERRARTIGWHRRFSLWLTRWRGTRERPGLMLALDRGGSCTGVAQRLDPMTSVVDLDRLLRREMSAKPATNVPRWIKLQTAAGPLRAIAFVADPAGPAYARRLPATREVEILALAGGHIGGCAEYLARTVAELERRNIGDSGMWRLQAGVAAFLSAHDGSAVPDQTVEVSNACEG